MLQEFHITGNFAQSANTQSTVGYVISWAQSSQVQSYGSVVYQRMV
jgi:hypothetical protein